MSFHYKSLPSLLILALVLVSCAPAPTEPFEQSDTEAPEVMPTDMEVPALPTAIPPTPAATPAPNPPPVPAFAFVEENAVLPQGEEGSWDHQFVDPGGIVFHEGLFHMFYNGIEGFPAPVGVGYATSVNGVEWEREGDVPLFTTQDLHPDDSNINNLFVTSALVEENGDWVLYYYTLESGNFVGPQSIYRATAPEPTGPWRADPEPALTPGPDNDWDHQQVSGANVVKGPNGYRMYYDAMGRNSMIGMATSEDGIHWTKYDDPQTADPPYGESDPILMPREESWDSVRVLDPNVVPWGDGWLMVYLANDGITKFNAGTYSFGYALSQDGINWTRPEENQILTNADSPTWSASYLATLLKLEDNLMLYFDFTSGGGGGTTVRLAVGE